MSFAWVALTNVAIRSSQSTANNNNVVGRKQIGEIFTSARDRVQSDPWNTRIWWIGIGTNRWVNQQFNDGVNALRITADNRTRRARTSTIVRQGPSLSNAPVGNISVNQNVVTTHRVNRNGIIWVRIGARRWIHEAIFG